MLQHSLTRRSPTVLLAGLIIATVVTATLFPSPAAAEPRLSHAPVERIARSGSADSEPLLDACPIDGSATFEDSWGWPRSGGRSHQGVDMIAARGTPVIAVRDGSAQFKDNRLGGRSIWITTADGDKFYYAHLQDWNGQSREVEAGDVIGWVGNTGNAVGTHLHFETLPGGAVENPYVHTLAACVPSREDLVTIEIDAANALNDPDVWARFVRSE
ncbi:MAG: M23 family metallopeptidase [Ilumatobacter sp.]